MSITVEAIIEELKRVQLPDGSNIVEIGRASCRERV